MTSKDPMARTLHCANLAENGTWLWQAAKWSYFDCE